MQRLLLCLAALPLTATAAAAQGTFDIRVDPRVELVSTVFTLMGSRDGWSERPLDSSYRARMHRRFSPFRNHPAIPAAAATRFGYNYPAEAILHFGPPPALEPRVAVAQATIIAAGGQQAFDAWIAGLRDFARDADFMRWFEAEQHAHDAMTTSVQALLGPLSIGDILDSYWGPAGHQRTLILAPLINRTIGYGARVEVEGGELELYSIQGPWALAGREPRFIAREPGRFVGMLLHEFSHSIVNPATAAAADEVAALAPLFAPIRHDMTRQAYSTWHIALDEHLVRAASTQMAARALPPELARQAAAGQRQRGFRYLDATIEALREEYEGRGRSFRDALPMVLQHLGRASR
jgi:hypothetical protein